MPWYLFAGRRMRVLVLEDRVEVDGAPVSAPPPLDTDQHQTAIFAVAVAAQVAGHPIRVVATDRLGRTHLVVAPGGATRVLGRGVRVGIAVAPSLALTVLVLVAALLWQTWPGHQPPPSPQTPPTPQLAEATRSVDSGPSLLPQPPLPPRLGHPVPPPSSGSVAPRPVRERTGAAHRPEPGAESRPTRTPTPTPTRLPDRIPSAMSTPDPKPESPPKSTPKPKPKPKPKPRPQSKPRPSDGTSGPSHTPGKRPHLVGNDPPPQLVG